MVDAISNSKEVVDAVSNPKSDPSSNPKIANYTTNRNFPQKLFNSRFVPNITPGANRPNDQLVTDDVPGIRGTLGTHQTFLPKEIVTDAARSGARIFQNPSKVSQTGRDGSMPQDVNTAVATTRLTPQRQIFNSTSNSPTRNGTQDIVNPIEPASPQWINTAQNSKLPLMDFLTKIAVLDPVLVK